MSFWSSDSCWVSSEMFANRKSNHGRLKMLYHGKRRREIWKQLLLLVLGVGLILLFFILDSVMVFTIHCFKFPSWEVQLRISLDDRRRFIQEEAGNIMYGRLLSLAEASITKNSTEDAQFLLLEDSAVQATEWIPCANKSRNSDQEKGRKHNGYILISANGGLNQQRVAVCNGVAIASLLNATLVLPKFLLSNVWQDTSQFGEIYQEEYFLDYLKNDVDIVKELPSHLQGIDFEAIGSQITDMEIIKEATPSYYIEVILPILQRNGIVHFLGFGNRLGFDPLPPHLQRLRCKCNFHALKFVPKIQQLGSLLVQRIRKYEPKLTEIDEQLFGNHMPNNEIAIRNGKLKRPSKYLALHMRFEVDMVAYSLCDFGGGRREMQELQMYREEHFPTLIARIQNNSISAEELRISGKCPLTPEEAALMLSALGYKSETYIYLAGSHIYGGLCRLQPFMQLFPNVVTKEDLLSPEELEPFKNFSSQLAALDFIACASSDVFAMTDSGSQLSSLVTGYRIYHGQGQAPTLRPNKKRFARILTEHETIDWVEFQRRVRNMIEENLGVTPRGRGRSVYRLPRTPGCMCKVR